MSIPSVNQTLCLQERKPRVACHVSTCSVSETRYPCERVAHRSNRLERCAPDRLVVVTSRPSVYADDDQDAVDPHRCTRYSARRAVQRDKQHGAMQRDEQQRAMQRDE